MKNDIKIDPANVDNVVADILDLFIMNSSNHPAMVQAMEEAGYSKEEADAYLKAFGKRVGRDLGFL